MNEKVDELEGQASKSPPFTQLSEEQLQDILEKVDELEGQASKSPPFTQLSE